MILVDSAGDEAASPSSPSLLSPKPKPDDDDDEADINRPA